MPAELLKHDFAEALPAGQEAPIVGFDVAVTDAAGRLQTVLGFLDKVPAAA